MFTTHPSVNLIVVSQPDLRRSSLFASNASSRGLCESHRRGKGVPRRGRSLWMQPLHSDAPLQTRCRSYTTHPSKLETCRHVTPQPREFEVGHTRLTWPRKSGMRRPVRSHKNTSFTHTLALPHPPRRQQLVPSKCWRPPLQALLGAPHVCPPPRPPVATRCLQLPAPPARPLPPAPPC